MSINPARWINDYGYWAAFVLVYMETAGIPLPGETALVIAGAASATGHLSFWPVVAVGAVAAILGDNTGYAIGRFGGRRVVEKLARLGRVASMLSWGERFFAKHGGKTVFLARWTAGLRIFGAWLAGMSRMRWRLFAAWNALGGVTWAFSVVGIGYLFAHSITRAESYVGTGGAIALGVVAAVGIGYGLHRLHRSQKAGAATPAPDQPRE